VISALAIPVRSLILTALGVGLAVGWYRWSHTGVIVVAAVSILIPLAVQVVGVGLIKQRPALALSIIELRAVAIAVASAALGAAATIIGIELAAPESTAEPNKTLITTAVAGLTAFVSSVALTAETMDKAIGDFTMNAFRDAFTVTAADGTLNTPDLEPGSIGQIALSTKYYGGWTDWSKPNRRARADALDKVIRGIRTSEPRQQTG
jgi:hypothetical protein